MRAPTRISDERSIPNFDKSFTRSEGALEHVLTLVTDMQAMFDHVLKHLDKAL